MDKNQIETERVEKESISGGSLQRDPKRTGEDHDEPVAVAEIG